MNDRLKDVLQLLRELQDELHGDANARARDTIDDAIRELELISGECHSEAQLKQLSLQVLGTVMRSIPAIIRLLNQIDF